ncbi:MAG: enoyl-CoA hydratase/isomerase family protein [Candidatus Binatia bacterium]|nr:enoyl-CoA hydratase/isomerase family protein [Candidatus Binatia bacterium]
MGEYETLQVEWQGSVGVVTLHRPERLNAWTPTMGKELVEAFRAFDADSGIRVVVLAGAGRAFCSGADLDFFRAQARSGEREGGVTRSEDFPLLLRQFSKPTIAALHGYALGVGATMALLCDLRIASSETQIGFLFARLGLMAELGSTYLLPRLVGLARACELLFTGKMYSAEQCAAWGLINRVVPPGQALEQALALASEIAECAPLSLRLTRQALYEGLENSFPGQLRLESLSLHYLYGTADHKEALQAASEKRSPVFTGR